MPTTTRGRRLRLADLFATGLVVSLAAVVGCAGKPFVNPPTELLDVSWQNRVPTGDTYPDPDATLSGGLASVFGNGRMPAPTPGRPLNILVIAGGGKYGAFTAGILQGWTESGTRPEFDVATGISSGALTAAMGFLGPRYDARLARAYTTSTQRDIMRIQPLRGYVLHRGIANSEPLADLIAENFDREAFCDLCAAHQSGRRLFIATVNMTTLRAAIWDLGAIATSGRPDAHDLVKKLLLASCSIPGVMPAVEINVELNGVHYKELHVDAGNVIQAFVRTANGLPPTSNIYILSGGKIYRDPLDEKPRLLKALGASVSNTLYALFREDAYKIYALCAVTGATYNLIAIPPDLRVEPGSMSFDIEEMQLMFRVGRQMAANGVPWRKTPPSSQPGESLVPRTGFEFVAEPCGPCRATPLPGR